MLGAGAHTAADDLQTVAFLPWAGHGGGLEEDLFGSVLREVAGGCESSDCESGTVELLGEASAFWDRGAGGDFGKDGREGFGCPVTASASGYDRLPRTRWNGSWGGDVRGGQVVGALKLECEPVRQRGGGAGRTDWSICACRGLGAGRDDVSAVGADVDLPGQGTVGA
ncbi:hypothetical protein A4V12_24645 [Streptomyces noursei]|nr:hypothetical protein A4V12_24645 [Streptomyces noursei]